MEGKCLSEAVLLSEPEESDSLCLFEDGGGGRRGAWGAGLDSDIGGCVFGFALLGEVTFDLSSRSRESSCTTTSATSASSVPSAACRASSHTDAVPEGSGDGDTDKSLPSFCSSSSLSFFSIILSSSPSNLADPPASSLPSSSSLSSESSKPSCARALAIFLRCTRT